MGQLQIVVAALVGPAQSPAGILVFRFITMSAVACELGEEGPGTHLLCALSPHECQWRCVIQHRL